MNNEPKEHPQSALEFNTLCFFSGTCRPERLGLRRLPLFGLICINIDDFFPLVVHIYLELGSVYMEGVVVSTPTNSHPKVTMLSYNIPRGSHSVFDARFRRSKSASLSLVLEINTWLVAVLLSEWIHPY